MPFLVKGIAALLVFLLTAGHNFHRLWKGGLIGTGIMLVADTSGHLFNLYHYKSNLYMIGGFLPFLHIPDIFLTTMLYLNWLPRPWSKRILFTIYISFIFLMVESIMYQAGGIIYTNWKLWYSYFLVITGLSLTAYLNDLVN